MRKLRWTLGLVLAAVLLAPVTLNQMQSSAQAQDAGKDALHEAMSTIDRNLRLLRRSLRDKNKNAESLELIAKMQEAVVVSKSAIPPRAAKVAESERAAFLTGYRREMAELLALTAQLELAVLAGDNDKAQELYEKIKATEEPGHQKYAEEGTN